MNVENLSQIQVYICFSRFHSGNYQIVMTTTLTSARSYQLDSANSPEATSANNFYILVVAIADRADQEEHPDR